MGNRRNPADHKPRFFFHKISICFADFLADDGGDFFLIHAIFAAGNHQHGLAVFSAEDNRFRNFRHIAAECISGRLCGVRGIIHHDDG